MEKSINKEYINQIEIMKEEIDLLRNIVTEQTGFLETTQSMLKTLQDDIKHSKSLLNTSRQKEMKLFYIIKGIQDDNNIEIRNPDWKKLEEYYKSV